MRFFIIVLFLFLSNCTEQTRTLEMTLGEKDISQDEETKGLVDSFRAVSVAIAKDGDNVARTSAGLLALELEPTSFQKALEYSLSQVDWFNTKDGIYTVEAEIISVERLVLSGDAATIQININYNVLNQDNNIIYRETIISKQQSYARPGARYAPRLITELSAKDNIKQFITKFAQYNSFQKK